jgi:hypothetical protein
VADREYDSTVLHMGKTRRGNVIRPMLRDDNQMSVGHAISVHDHPYTLRLEYVSHASPDSLRHDDDSLRCDIVNVGEVIDVRNRNDHAFPPAPTA